MAEFLSVATANGNIRPSRFVKIDTTVDNRVIEGTSASQPIGISQKGTRRTPLTGLDDGYAAIAGEGLGVYQNVQTAPLYLDEAVSPGDKLAVGSTGGGRPAVAGEWYGAVAPQSGSAGQILEVQLMIGQLDS